MNKTFTRLKNSLVAIALFSACSITTAFAQTAYTQAPPAANGVSGNYRGPSSHVDFQRTAMIYRGSEVVGVPPGNPITALGFLISTPAATPAIGTIKIYMVNTADVNYSRGTTWTTIITPAAGTAMTLVYDGALTVPNTAGFYNIPLTTPFAWTGGNFYLAYEWTVTTKATGTQVAIYDANTDVAGGLQTGFGTTMPATLANASAFRPILNIGYTPAANDLMIKDVFVQGKMAITGGTPDTIMAAIKNNGSNPILNRTLTLSITGANTFTTTAVVPFLGAGLDTVVKFLTPFAPTVVGNNFAEVTAPTDDNPSNNSADANIVATTNTIGYAQYPTTGAKPDIVTAFSGVYPVTGATATTRNAKFLARFFSEDEIAVNKVRAYIPGAAFNPVVNTTGITVYAIVLNSAGVEVGRSANKTITGAMTDNMVEFDITTPSAPTFNFETYYIGMVLPAQSVPAATPAIIYALGVQEGPVVREGTFYVAPAVGNSQPEDYESEYRFVLEAQISVPTAVKEQLNAKLVSVYPNPSNGTFNVSAAKMKGGNATMEVRDMQGKTVYNASVAKEAATLNLSGLAAGTYLLKVSTDQEIAIKRIVIQ